MVRQVTNSGPQTTESKTKNDRETRGATIEQIRLRAFQIYEARGCIAGHDIEDWTQAERELRRNL